MIRGTDEDRYNMIQPNYTNGSQDGRSAFVGPKLQLTNARTTCGAISSMAQTCTNI